MEACRGLVLAGLGSLEGLSFLLTVCFRDFGEEFASEMGVVSAASGP